VFTKVTNGIVVNVEVFYLPRQSNALQNEFSFAYRITIENQSNAIVKLMRRHWRIADTNGTVRTIGGEGVVGQQPVLETNESYTYTSGCVLTTEIGKMSGTYSFMNMQTMSPLEVIIPAFDLLVPYKMN
jgi:ApaG protein